MVLYEYYLAYTVDITIQTYKYEYIFMLPSQTYSNSVFGEFHTNDCWFCIFVPKVFCPCFFSSSTVVKEAFYISALACVVPTYAIWLNDFTHSVKKFLINVKILQQNINVIKYLTFQMKV